MAVEAKKIKDRLRALYPKANLSTKRMDDISAKLSKKLPDDADEAAIDEVITDYNDNGAMTFEEIAKADDKIRTLEAKKPESKPEVQPDPETDPMKILLAGFQTLQNEIKGLKEEKVKETIGSRFSSDERVKNIPEFIRVGYVPTSEDDYEDKVTALVDAYRPFAEKHKLEGFGNDKPASSTDGSAASGKPKPIDMDTARAIVK